MNCKLQYLTNHVVSIHKYHIGKYNNQTSIISEVIFPLSIIWASPPIFVRLSGESVLRTLKYFSSPGWQHWHKRYCSFPQRWKLNLRPYLVQLGPLISVQGCPIYL